MENVKELLPIGSIVRLRGGKKRVMVFGVKQRDRATNKEYDYIGVVYPEGNLGENGQFFFQHDAVETVVFRGFEDEERTVFLEKLDDFYRRRN